MICPKCGTPNVDVGRFCFACGARLKENEPIFSKSTEPSKDLSGYTCRHCHKENEPIAKFCRHCGVRLQKYRLGDMSRILRWRKNFPDI